MATTSTPAPAVPATSRNTDRPGWLVTNQTLQNERILRTDRIVHQVWYRVLLFGATFGAIALLSTCFNVGVEYEKKYGERPEPQIIERVIERPAPVPPQAEPERSRSPWSLPANK